MKTMLPTISRTKKKKVRIDMECYRSRIWTGIAKEMQLVTIPQITKLLLQTDFSCSFGHLKEHLQIPVWLNIIHTHSYRYGILCTHSLGYKRAPYWNRYTGVVTKKMLFKWCSSSLGHLTRVCLPGPKSQGWGTNHTAVGSLSSLASFGAGLSSEGKSFLSLPSLIVQ